MFSGIFGAFRREKLYNTKTEDADKRNNLILVNNPFTKTHIQLSFVVTIRPNAIVNYLYILVYHKFVNFRQVNASYTSFFNKKDRKTKTK